MKLLITGATGYIGRNLLKRLLLNGELNINILARGNTSIPGIDSVSLIRQDICNLVEDVFRNRSYDIAVHLAALMSDKDYLPRSEFERVNVEGTRKLVMSLRGCRLKQFIHISTVGVYGPTGVAPVREEEAYGNNLTDYEWSKMEAEKVVLDCCRRIGIPVTILRLGLMYGDGMKYVWPNIIDSIANNKMKIIGEGKALIQLSYIRDIIEGISLALGNRSAYDSVLNICGAQVCSISEVFSTIADLLGVARPKKIPFTPVYLLSRILSHVPDSLKTLQMRLITPHRVSFFKDNHVYSIVKANKVLNFNPQYDIYNGMKGMIESYGRSQA